jgi:hypothetical protein
METMISPPAHLEAGGTVVRKIIAVAVIAFLSVVCMAAAPAHGALVGVTEAHMTIEVPTGWAYLRNDTSTGSKSALYLTSPLSGGYMVIGMISADTWSGSVSADKLYDTLRTSVEDSGLTVSSYVVAPRNITINGLAACDATITAIEGSITVEERITITASDPWNLGYVLVFAGVTSIWGSYSSAIDSCIMSLTVAEKTSTGGIGTTAILAIAAVVIVVAVVVVVLMMRRKKPEPALAPPASWQQTPPPAPPQSP